MQLRVDDLAEGGVEAIALSREQALSADEDVTFDLSGVTFAEPYSIAAAVASIIGNEAELNRMHQLVTQGIFLLLTNPTTV